jgi:hypothetical protein
MMGKTLPTLNSCMLNLNLKGGIVYNLVLGIVSLTAILNSQD